MNSYEHPGLLAALEACEPVCVRQSQVLSLQQAPSTISTMPPVISGPQG